MRLLIDNMDERGAVDYTTSLDADTPPRVLRRLNRPAELRAALVSDSCGFQVPVLGARVVLEANNGAKVFTGYVSVAPGHKYLGWGTNGPVYRYRLTVTSDEFILDRKSRRPRPPFIQGTAGGVLKQLTSDLLPGQFDLSGVQDLETLAALNAEPLRPWSEVAADVAGCARASYRVHDGNVTLEPVGARTHLLSETSNGFDPTGLSLHAGGVRCNDVTIVGRTEPRCHVRDYFLGDGLGTYFSLSHAPFTSYGSILLDEEYKGALDPAYWSVTDPGNAIGVSGGRLNVGGGEGDGMTTVIAAEKVELGGGVLLQHGEVTFNAASDGVIGGIYAGAVSVAGCLAGFRVSPSGAQSSIRGLVNGVPTGATVTTVSGHRYALATRLYATQVHRVERTFHSSLHPSGEGRGGASIPAEVRVVLELRDINAAAPDAYATPATILYEGVLSGAAAACFYAPVNSIDLHCSLSFARVRHISEAEIRSAMPNQSFRTRLTGEFADGAECTITDGPELRFYPEYPPAVNEQVVVRYRSRARAMARVTAPQSIAALARGNDDGVRAAAHSVVSPSARTASECEQCALAVLDDSTQPSWSGEYRCWSDALPGADGDLVPGDAIAVSVPSAGANFVAITREVEIEMADLWSEHSRYRIAFADEAAEPLALAFEAAHLSEPADENATTETAGNHCLADLTAAEVTAVTATNVTIDAGVNPSSDGGFEVRRTDGGWGVECDRNLVGRFTARTFEVARITRVMDFYLRQYDASSPRKYSRYSTALHVDYPL